MSIKLLDLINSGLCLGCGTCVAICPVNAINLIQNSKKGLYLPTIDLNSCIKCNKCIECCPGNEVNFKILSNFIFGDENFQDIIKCYVGFSNNHNIRNNSSSGGMITELLLYMLEKKIIDGAIVTRFKSDNPLEPEPFIARSKEEIINASKSKYCPVPTNLSLKQVLNGNPNEKYAFVGLPCHIHGLRKAQLKNPALRNSIIITFSLMCSHVDSFHYIDFIVNKLNIDEKNIKKLEFRGRGWPGTLLIEDDRTIQEIEYNDYIQPHKFSLFTPKRCLFCFDGIGLLADVAFGDAWNLGGNDKIGTNLCVVRTPLGNKIIKDAELNRNITIKNADLSDVKEAQKPLFIDKVQFCNFVLGFYKKFKFRIPYYSPSNYFSDKTIMKKRYFLKFFVITMNRKILAKKIFWRNNDEILKFEEKMMKFFWEKQ